MALASPIAAAVVFVVSLLIGALGIYAGARVIVGRGDYDHAIVTALIGAIVWAIVGFVVGWIPLLGPLLALVAYVGVINWRYPGDWTAAAMIGLVAWVTVLLVLYALAALGVTGFEAVGVPGL
ncbi:hypothetical protein C488_05082 [Natrinema pellirubrum DSM 15624]|uniref:Uncharacterized protein n=1 Tax=Natrinema pellirubrum (strain DSM 15624 / CIP 106293 / JCM 10476 / NCIMB 786 / 157) TaxID=797303 RepID=L0JFI9_NATP1|nr:hypothetical protein [Natrinema pellirubrum]AGB30280.1 hypothetical protein Natpe_0348 [Natrinema pellirubrum DSM 15624]ELY79047.1 hypothetical protein C488_05082 [Natrinema pellirubrum DSM 15624]